MDVYFENTLNRISEYLPGVLGALLVAWRY